MQANGLNDLNQKYLKKSKLFFFESKKKSTLEQNWIIQLVKNKIKSTATEKKTRKEQEQEK